jgi:hypothetical protein
VADVHREDCIGISEGDFMMSRSSTALGTTILCVGLVMLLELPKITPYQFFNCSPYDGGTQCFGSINTVYAAIFVVSMSGAILLFFGLFGRNFILSPLFIIGMLLDAWGLLGIIFGYTGFESCVSGKFPYSLCMAYHPEATEPFILVGSILIAVMASLPCLSSLGELHKMTYQAVAKFIGLVSITIGPILLSFGWMIVDTFVGNFDTLHSVYWTQIAMGLVLVPAGIALVSLSFRVRRAEIKIGTDDKSVGASQKQERTAEAVQ